MGNRKDKNGIRERLSAAVKDFSSTTIMVVGDIMLDQFVWGEVSRISPEAPVPVVNVERETFLLGGAANVANNLRSLGANAVLSGITGDDHHADVLNKLAKENGINTMGIIKTERPTTLKTRIVARGQQVVRVDREETGPVSQEALALLMDSIGSMLAECRCIIVSDYDKGVISKKIMTFLTKEASAGQKFLLVDPKPSNALLYRNATVITPNEKEAMEMSGAKPPSDDKTVRKAAVKIADSLNAKGILITRGNKGMALWQPKKGMFTIPTMAKEVFDVTGAGDTVISTLALGLASGLKMCEAAYLANLAAGIVVGKVGTAAVGREELLAAIDKTTDGDLKFSQAA